MCKREAKGVSLMKWYGRERDGTYLEPSNEEAVGRNLGEAIGAELQQREYAPADVKEGDDPVHWEHSEEEHERYLAHNRPDCVHGLQLDQLVAREAEVVFHSGYVRIICQLFPSVSKLGPSGSPLCSRPR